MLADLGKDGLIVILTGVYSIFNILTKKLPIFSFNWNALLSSISILQSSSFTSNFLLEWTKVSEIKFSLLLVQFRCFSWYLFLWYWFNFFIKCQASTSQSSPECPINPVISDILIFRMSSLLNIPKFFSVSINFPTCCLILKFYNILKDYEYKLYT